MATQQRILIVSDRRSKRNSVGDVLSRGGYAVTVASSFELPFAVARQQPDLVLFDVGETVPSTSSLVKLLRDNPSECPIILYSEGGEAALAQLAQECGVTGHVCEPARPEALLETLAPHLSGRSAKAPAAAGPAGSPARTSSLPAGATTGPRDFVAFSRQSTRSEFVAACPFPFLVYTAPLVPARSERTVGLLDGDSAGQRVRNAPASRSVRAIAIRKTTSTAAETITVGRTSENDVVIDHHHVSRLHAIFRKKEGGLTLADAGSRNGTWVAGRLLEPEGASSGVLAPGEVVRFGELELTYMTPTGCWDVLRVNVR